MNKNLLKIFNFIMCLTIIAFMIPIEALAMDSPIDGHIEEFPVPGNQDTVIVDNYGTINYAKTGGQISYNHYHINNLEGAIVGENEDTGVIDVFVSGRVDNNYGTINYVNNTASIGTNAPNGLIKENFNNVDKNMGTIEKQYSGAIKENYGNVGTIGESATIEKMYEGTITENSGNVVIGPEPNGIVTTVNIGTNKGTVKIEADIANKSAVAIGNNETGASLYVCAGADCTVTNNAGKIEIAKGGTCTITGTNTGEVIKNTTSDEEYDYELILDNVELADITFDDFFRTEGDKIYVMSGGTDSVVIVEYDTNKYYYPDAIKENDVIAIRIENSDYSVLDDVNKTFTVHFHTMGEYEHSSGEKHVQKCGGNWKGSECTATFNEESCSLLPATCKSKAKCEKCGTEYGNFGDCSYGDWIIDSEAKVGVEGKKHRVCSVCKDVEYATIPAISDNENKKSDNEQNGNKQGSSEQSGNEPSVNPSKADAEQAANQAKENTAQAENSTKVDTKVNTKVNTAPVVNSTKQNSKQVIKPTATNNADVIKATKPNTDNSESVVGTNDSGDIDSKSASDDSKSSPQEMDATEGFKSNEAVSSSNMSKIGIVAGGVALATVAATACFFILYRNRR